MWSAYRLTAPLRGSPPGELKQVTIPVGEVVEFNPNIKSGTMIAVLWKTHPLMVVEAELHKNAESVKD